MYERDAGALANDDDGSEFVKITRTRSSVLELSLKNRIKTQKIRFGIKVKLFKLHNSKSQFKFPVKPRYFLAKSTFC